MLVARIQWGVQSKVDADPTPHDLLPIDFLPYGDGGLYIEEGHNDAAEGFEGCPGMNGAVPIYRFTDLY